jgi:4-hydroxy-tetrahydrodipicolinate synthase
MVKTSLRPVPDCLAAQVSVFAGLTSGDPEAAALAEGLHKELLPLIVFMTRSIQGLLCYGKRVMARRLGLEVVHDRPGALPPTPFGLAEMERLWGGMRRAEEMLLPALQERLAGCNPT